MAEHVGRSTAVVSAWNLVSRATGFLRVLAMAAALGTTALGDAYQAANLVSNLLFELMAGGALATVLVPRFVGMLDDGRRTQAAVAAGAIMGRALALLAVVVAVGMLVAPSVMEVLTVGVEEAETRRRQIELGSYLLVFFLPQVLLYAVGAVTTALLHADRRFAAAAAAPVANNLVVIATMVAFRSMRGGATGFSLSGAEKLVLALGTTAGVVAMTVVPLLAVGRTLGKRPRPRWSMPPDQAWDGLAKQGLWAAGPIGFHQVMVAITIVLAARVEGGVVAYQVAFTFFLLPHAVLAHPIFTTTYPSLVSTAREGRLADLAAQLSSSLSTLAFLLLPAAGMMAALAGPVLALVRVGNLDAEGASLVASVMAAFAVGLFGYSVTFLFTRVSYAMGEVRGPTVVALGVTCVAGVLMFVMSSAVQGDARVMVLGLAYGAAVTLGAVALARHVIRLLGHPLTVGVGLGRTLIAAGIASLLAWGASTVVGTGSRAHAALGIGAGLAVGGAFYAVAQWRAGAPELAALRHLARGGSG